MGTEQRRVRNGTGESQESGLNPAFTQTFAWNRPFSSFPGTTSFRENHPGWRNLPCLFPPHISLSGTAFFRENHPGWRNLPCLFPPHISLSGTAFFRENHPGWRNLPCLFPPHISLSGTAFFRENHPGWRNLPCLSPTSQHIRNMRLPHTFATQPMHSYDWWFQCMLLSGPAAGGMSWH